GLPGDSRLLLLAPLIRDRKGEHLHVFDQLKAQGFVRVRVDGRVYELDEVPKRVKNKKHSIEAVVDRFKVRDDIGLRLAESFETALNLSSGIAIIAPMDKDTAAQEHLFSSRFACPVCDYSISELEPRLFSFNNPAGACPSCDGLGVKQFFDVDRVIQDQQATLAEGAIRGWDRRNLFYFNMLSSLADHYGFDIDTPFKKLKASHQQVILFGTGDEEITFNYVNDRGTVFKRKHRFEGIIPNLERRYRETECQSV